MLERDAFGQNAAICQAYIQRPLGATQRTEFWHCPIHSNKPLQAFDEPIRQVGSNQWRLHWFTLPRRKAKQDLQR